MFADAEAFLVACAARTGPAAWSPTCGCRACSGVELQARAAQPRQHAAGRDHHRARRRAHGARAFRAEAVDFLEKPFDDAQLRAAIDKAFALRARAASRSPRSAQRDAAKLAALTPREREVLEHAARGLHAKEIGASLGISPRTVEVHKTRIMEKLGVRNVAELVRFALAAERPDAD